VSKKPPVTRLPAAPAHGVGVRITAYGYNSSHSSTDLEGRAPIWEERGGESIHIAVILQMIQDLKSNCRKGEAARLKKDAERWFASGDFILTCELAGLDPDWVKRKMAEASSRNFQWRLPNGQGWRTKGRREREDHEPV